MLGLIILGLIVIVLFKFFKSTRIKWRTLFKRGVHIDKGRYGVSCYCGKQGSSKTSSAVEWILDNVSKDFPLYANIRSLKGVEYTYFSGLEGLLDIYHSNVSNCIIFFDEIFTLLSKSDKLSKEILSFLSQMRKRKIYFITTAQEWLEINMTLRRYCRYQIQCSIITLPLLGSYSFKQINNAEQMKWSVEDNEYIAPLIINTISKLNISTLSRYDTYETINSSYIPPTLVYNK